MTEREKMVAGELYDPQDAQLVTLRTRARDLLWQLNATRESDAVVRGTILTTLFGTCGAGVWLQPPFYCDYGFNIHLGEKVYFNFNCVLLDVCPIRIGARTLVGPAVQMYAATHPLDSELRKTRELGAPITIGSDVWIGGGAIICPGVTIGDRSVIGAGSVVTKDVPAGVLAVGNPCRVLREVK